MFVILVMMTLLALMVVAIFIASLRNQHIRKQIMADRLNTVMGDQHEQGRSISS